MSNQLNNLLYNKRNYLIYFGATVCCVVAMYAQMLSSLTSDSCGSTNYVVSSTLSNHFRTVATQPNHNMRVCAYPV